MDTPLYRLIRASLAQVSEHLENDMNLSQMSPAIRVMVVGCIVLIVCALGALSAYAGILLGVAFK